MGTEKFIFDHLRGVATFFDLEQDPNEAHGQPLSASQREHINRWFDIHLAFPRTWSQPPTPGP
jgi:hypothetical protein